MPNMPTSTTQPLRDLARELMHKHGWSLETVALQSGSRGKSWFGKHLAEKHRDRPLSPEDVQAIADGLKVSYQVVRRADLAGHGLVEVDAGPDVMDSIQRDPHLLPEARAHLLQQYALLLRLHSGSGPVGANDDDPQQEHDTRSYMREKLIAAVEGEGDQQDERVSNRRSTDLP